MLKIVAEEQDWLNVFNGRYGTDYKQGDVVEEDELIGFYFTNGKILTLEVREEVEKNGFDLRECINFFNENVANGEAIWLEVDKVMSKDDTISEKVRQWAKVRNLDTANPKSQLLKGFEELSELSVGVNKQQEEKIVDSMGDIQVVLIILAQQLGIDYEQSLDYAYEQIKDRKGMMIDGTFVKYADLSKENQDILDNLEE